MHKCQNAGHIDRTQSQNLISMLEARRWLEGDTKLVSIFQEERDPITIRRYTLLSPYF